MRWLLRKERQSGSRGVIIAKIIIGAKIRVYFIFQLFTLIVNEIITFCVVIHIYMYVYIFLFVLVFCSHTS